MYAASLVRDSDPESLLLYSGVCRLRLYESGQSFKTSCLQPIKMTALIGRTTSQQKKYNTSVSCHVMLRIQINRCTYLTAVSLKMSHTDRERETHTHTEKRMCIGCAPHKARLKVFSSKGRLLVLLIRWCVLTQLGTCVVAYGKLPAQRWI